MTGPKYLQETSKVIKNALEDTSKTRKLMGIAYNELVVCTADLCILE